MVSCVRDKCEESDRPLGAAWGMEPMYGKLDDPNHLQGSRSDVKTGVGYGRNGTHTWSITWDLARQGVSQ